MILRALWSRRGLSTALWCQTVLVGAGCYVAVAFARIAGMPRGTALSLLLIGVVAVAASAQTLVRRRRHEIGLAALRGRHGVRLLWYAVAEPLVVLVVGGACGAGVGWWLTGRLAAGWLPGASGPYTTAAAEWVAVGVVVLVCAATVSAASVRVVRRPLLHQLTGRERVSPAGTAALFGQLLVVIAAVVAVYQARQAGTTHRLDWVSLLSPALVGLAAGQVLVWLLAAASRRAARRRHRSIGRLLAVARLGRRADSVLVVRVVIAAAVLVAVAAGAFMAGQGWRAESSRLAVGAPLSFPVKSGALQAYAASHTADPDGKWLMAVAAFETTPANTRRLFADTSRWGRVVGGFLSSTRAAPATNLVDRVDTGTTVPYGHGNTFSVTVPATALPHGAKKVTFTIEYVDDSGNVNLAAVTTRPGKGTPVAGGGRRYSTALNGCTRACSPQALLVNIATSSTFNVYSSHFQGPDVVATEVTGLSFAGLDLLHGAAAPRMVSSHRVAVHDLGAGRGLQLRVRVFDPTRLGTWHVGDPLPAVVADGTHLPHSTDPFPAYGVDKPGHTMLHGPDGQPVPVTMVATVPAVPLIGVRGSVVDLATALRGARNSIPATKAYVLARSDTPANVLAALRGTGTVGTPHTFDARRQAIDDSPLAHSATEYVIVAALAGGVALISLLLAVLLQVRERRREAASLRAAGVPPDAVTRGTRVESAALAVAVLVAAGIASWVASAALLAALPLVDRGRFQVPLESAPDLWLVGAVGVGAALVVGGVWWLSLAGIARSARPRLLRGEGEA